MNILSAFAFLCCCTTAAQAVTMDFAHVGNAGNAADPTTGSGAVADNYAISKTEVTNEQYTEFSTRLPQPTPTVCTTRA